MENRMFENLVIKNTLRIILWRVRRALKTNICVFLILSESEGKINYEENNM